MFDRNKLAHLVFWPDVAKAALNLVDPHGVVVAAYRVSEPVLGSDIARRVPDGFAVEASGCVVLTMSGLIRVSTRGEFDTAVVTERHRPTADERLAALERRALRRERREEAYIRELEEKIKQAGENADVVEVVEREADGEAAPEGTASAEATVEAGAAANGE